MSLPDPVALKAILESLIFISGKALGTSDMVEALESVPNGPRPSRKELEAALDELVAEWEGRGGGIRLVRVAEGYAFRSDPSCSSWVRGLNRPKAQRLSVPAVETLAMIAYRQPITRSEIEEVRGVDSGAVLKSLSDRRLIRIVGRKEEPGRPLLYATSKEFLEFFGLRDLAELPPLKEFEEMAKLHAASAGEEIQPLTVADLLTSSEEIEVTEDDDRKALEDLDVELKTLKEKEKEASAGLKEATPETEPSGA